MPDHSVSSASSPVTVYFDGACPVCSREVAFYRRLKGGDAIRWVDASACAGGDLGADLNRDRALARLHVRRDDGSLAVGGGAFIEIWRRLPVFAPLAFLFRGAGARRVLDRAYDGFLRVRARVLPPSAHRFAATVTADLRTDHAGETGAVMIYRGILAVTRDPGLQDFARRHLETERGHLALIEAELPPSARSRLLALWRGAGWLTGALPALFGPRAVHATVDAVESFVDRHYADQIARLEGREDYRPLRDLLARCRDDEVAHRDEARAAIGRRPGAILRPWCRIVGAGSAAAVALARRV